MTTTDLNRVNIASRQHKTNPFPFYKRLREDQPVFPIVLPDRRTIWLVTRYEDVAHVLRDKKFAKDLSNAPNNQSATQPWIPRFAKPLTRHMLNSDPPDHARLKALVTKAFLPSMVEKMHDRIHELSIKLLTKAKAGKPFDLIQDYALPIPTTVIAEMLGVPPHHGKKFNRWSNAVLEAVSTKWGMIRSVPKLWAFVRYIRQFVQSRQKDLRQDLASELVKAEIDGSQLSEDELVAMIFLLLFAGHETTVNLIGNGVHALLEHPDQLEQLREDTKRIDSAVEEMLRYGSPVEMATERYALEDIEISGTTIPAGSLVGAVIASANRDARQFTEPDKLDLLRSPNKHLAFGLGAHYCTGASLARLEGKIAIKTLLEEIPHFKLAVPANKLRWRRGLVTRGLESLPILPGK